TSLNFALFQGSFGFFQTYIGRLKARGELSETPRYSLESVPAVIGNTSRSGLTVAPFLGDKGALLEGWTKTLSYGFQLLMIGVLTAPGWIKLWMGDRQNDLRTNEQFLRNEPNQTSGEAVGGCVSQVSWFGRIVRKINWPSFS